MSVLHLSTMMKKLPVQKNSSEQCHRNGEELMRSKLLQRSSLFLCAMLKRLTRSIGSIPWSGASKNREGLETSELSYLAALFLCTLLGQVSSMVKAADYHLGDPRSILGQSKRSFSQKNSLYSSRRELISQVSMGEPFPGAVPHEPRGTKKL